jgi:transcriptional/translational regulatory protein YebC/TACO1
VAFQFSRRGEIVVATPDSAAEDRLMELALEAGAEDVANGDGRSTVICAPTDFEAVKKAIEAAGVKPESADIVMAPANRVKVEGEALEDLLDMLDRLEGLDDVQEVYHNADLPPEPVED